MGSKNYSLLTTHYSLILNRFPKIFLIFVLVLVGLFLIYPVVNAASLVPCGRNTGTPEEMRPCTTCDLFSLSSRIVNFVLFTVVPAVAVLFYLIGGLMILLSRGSPGLVATGKNFFWNTTWGLVMIFSAWMITNTVLKSLVGDNDISNNWYKIECTSTVQQPPPSTQTYTCSSENRCVVAPSGTVGKHATSNCNNECQKTGGTLSITTTSLSDAIVGQEYSHFVTVSGGTTPYTFYTTSGGMPPGLDLYEDSSVGGVPTTAGQFTFTVEVTDSSTPAQSATGTVKITVKPVGATPTPTPTPTPTLTSSPTPTPTVTSGVQCLFNGINLCQGQPLKLSGGKLVPDSRPVCGTSTCNQYTSALTSAAQKTGISLNLLKATIYKESACQISAANTGGNSYGLMQLQPGTANTFRQYCGVSETITSSWLTNPANATASICIGAYFYKSLADGACGFSPRNILAGYSAGPGRCQASRDCANDTSCEGKTVQQWECLYDNPQHTVCNGDNTVIGAASKLNETRYSVVNKLYCVDHPGF